MAWVAPITWVDGVTPGNATNLNGIRDSLKAVGDAWTTYTPTLTATPTPPTMGASVLTGRYRNTGKTWDVHINLAIGAGFAIGSGTWRFTLPAGLTPLMAQAAEVWGYATARDVSASVIAPYLAIVGSATTVAMVNTSTGTLLNTTAPPWTWATGDLISIHIPNIENT